MYASLNGAESNLNNLDKVEYLNNNTDNDYNSNSEDKNYTNTSNNNDNNSDNRSSDINNNFNLNCLSITWLLCVIWGFFWVFDFYSSSHLLISFDISPIHLKTALTVPFLSLKNFFQTCQNTLQVMAEWIHRLSCLHIWKQPPGRTQSPDCINPSGL